ncbi:protein PHLOEM PROTEIN 2-LIKE A9-like protein [Carex littledalei]|uniref:Protein PHLOEM PROTEIN 2-LIKE A9-like protein n=1 Tax=Carex littledalei TaxID=544730 RepID=A0A833QL69_9POAL|nr:protein PHLOEM PROTEIN 2-LIKE A9-like protein [Carex littledalei]
MSTSSSPSPHYKGSTQPNAEQHVHEKEGTVVIKPLALDIIWGKDSRYWHLDAEKNIAELVQVSWLEVNGSLGMKHLKPGTRYKLEFKVMLKPDAFGWNNSPVYIMVKPGKNSNYIWKNTDLSKIKEEQKSSTFTIPSGSFLEFAMTSSSDDDKLTFGLFEIWARKWKGGLVIKEVVISEVQ